MEPAGEIPTLELKDQEDIPKLILTEKEVTRRLESLKPGKSPGMDNMHPSFIREIAAAIAKPMTGLFNQSMEAGRVPFW